MVGSTRGPDGSATRERLIETALVLFGNQGLAVGAREIAATAGVPLSAIPYHFGTKEALYRAALGRVGDRLREALGPAAAAARAALDEPPEQASTALRTLQGALLEAIAANPEAESWAKLLLREHLDPSAAFDLVYEDAAKEVVELMAALVARAEGRPSIDAQTLLRAFALLGEVLVFRVVRHAVVRRLGWKDLDAGAARKVRAALGW